jgi:hypothetical protein
METMAQAQLPSTTASDTGTKRPRTFQCRDLLWEGLEQMAGELECTVDFLINDALKHYLRNRQRLPPLAPPSVRPAERPTPPAQPIAPPMPQPVFGPPPPPLPLPPRPPPFVGGQTIALPQPIPAAPPPLPRPPLPPPPGFVPPPPGFATPPPMPRPPPLPPPSFRGAPPMPPPPMPPRLTVTYGHHTREVEGPGFIIGRGKQASGLTIKDPNISRSHATIEMQDGVYYLVDLGSTNGTLVNGAPIQRKPIMEGDVARICDHEIRFSYRRTP